MNLMKTCSPVSYSLLATLLFPLFILSCGRYPTIPKIERTPGAQVDQTAPKQETIGDIFQKKATGLVPYTEKEDKDYEIGPKDVLYIMVWKHDDLDREVCVSREGEFSYPLIGMVNSEGLTIAQLEKEIRDGLSGRFIINPQVTITVKEYKSKPVFLLGEIGGPERSGKGPGTYPLTGKTTLVEILSLAGGPTKDAGNEVVVIRGKV